MVAATPRVTYDAQPVLKKVDDYYQVIYHFRIPQSYISNTNIRMAALYPSSANNEDDANAYYLFTQTDSTGKLV